jgi:ABC-2 type transport system ATP-binding protein
MMLQASNLRLPNAEKEVIKVLKMVRMEGAAGNKFKNCSLGMKQRVGIAMALLGDPTLLVLDEPLNGLDADGMRIMREILVDITKLYGCTVLISSHILGELEKIATHYGIIQRGKMIQELTAQEMDSRARVFISLKTADMSECEKVLSKKYDNVRREGEYLRVYDVDDTESVVEYLLQNSIVVSEIVKNKIGLEEYYVELMSRKEN